MYWQKIHAIAEETALWSNLAINFWIAASGLYLFFTRRMQFASLQARIGNAAISGLVGIASGFILMAAYFGAGYLGIIVDPDWVVMILGAAALAVFASAFLAISLDRPRRK